MNLRKILKAIGLLNMTTPLALVTECGNLETEMIFLSEEEIIEAINKTIYEITISVKQDLSFLKAEVDFNFIKKRLSSEVTNSFSDELFSLVTFLNNENKELEDADLQPDSILDVKIEYNYGEFSKQLTKLKLIILPAE